jgi:ankyrin repeat protein
MSGDLEVIDLLLKAKADPLAMAEKEDIAPQGSAFRENLGATSVLQAAAGVGWRAEVSRGRDRDAIETIKLLLARGADINQANQAGDTPLHGAAVRGSPDIVAFLLQHGANPELRNARKLTALDIALGQADYRILPNEAVANVLRQHTLAKLSNNGR